MAVVASLALRDSVAAPCLASKPRKELLFSAWHTSGAVACPRDGSRGSFRGPVDEDTGVAVVTSLALLVSRLCCAVFGRTVILASCDCERARFLSSPSGRTLTQISPLSCCSSSSKLSNMSEHCWWKRCPLKRLAFWVCHWLCAQNAGLLRLHFIIVGHESGARDLWVSHKLRRNERGTTEQERHVENPKLSSAWRFRGSNTCQSTRKLPRHDAVVLMLKMFEMRMTVATKQWWQVMWPSRAWWRRGMVVVSCLSVILPACFVHGKPLFLAGGLNPPRLSALGPAILIVPNLPLYPRSCSSPHFVVLHVQPRK